MGIAAVQLGRQFGIDLSEVATKSKKEFTHGGKKQHIKFI